ncbi:MAG: hypothetical protein MR385_07665 [Treponema berlinense]|nr:hypothetical protein [Treponema berlinense]
MKKIVTAAAIAAMAASFAAAEVTTSLNVRVRPDLYKVVGTTENGTTDAYTTTTYADIDGFGGNKDTLAVKGSTDYAGVAAEITLLNPGNAKGKTGAFEIDNYYGWLNWGALKFTAGTYDSRYTNRGNYTATEQGILDEEFSKTMGLSSKNGLSVNGDGWLADFGNVSQVNGGNNNSFIVDYTFNDIGGGKLLLKGGLVENGTADSYDSYTDKDGNKFAQSEGYVFEAAWRKDDLVAVDAIFKNPVKDAFGFGLYVTPLMIPNTKNVVIGFTYGTLEDSIKSAFAVDFRGQYNFNSAATLALGAKYESYEADADNADTETAMQIAAEFSYKVSDLLIAALDFGYFNKDIDNNDDNDDDNSQFIVTSLRGKFTAGKNAAITTALRLNKVLNPGDGKTDYTFDIPVVLRVKM